MKKMLLASAMALLFAAPVLAAEDHHGHDQGTGGASGGGHHDNIRGAASGGGHHDQGTAGGSGRGIPHGQGTGGGAGAGSHSGFGQGSGGRHFGNTTGGGGSSANPFTGGGGQATGGHTGSGQGRHFGSTGGGSHNNTSIIFGIGGHGYRSGSNFGHSRHNSAFDQFRRAIHATHRYHDGSYYRPSGWYEHTWNYGDFLPALFFADRYQIDDYDNFGLSDPPDGTVWVRYGSDALLVDEDTGEIIQVIYGIFY